MIPLAENKAGQRQPHFPFRYFPWEVVVWCGALLALAFMNPYTEHSVSLCPLHALGFKFCPGCGLGHSISFFLRGDWQQAWAAHPLGIPAVMILANRIRSLLSKGKSFEHG